MTDDRLPASSRATGPLAVSGAFAFWGVAVVYWKLLADVASVEIVIHRIVWTAVLAGALLLPRRRWAAVLDVLRTPRQAGRQVLSSAMIAANWLTFVWGTNHGRVVECSMGYFICPMVSVLLGRLVLGERLRPARAVAAAFVAAGVGYLVIGYGRVPWVALALAGTFALYGLLRKTSPLDSLPGLAADMSLLALPAAGYLLWLTAGGRGALGHADTATHALLLGAGPVTALPLLLFAFGARRTYLTTVGFLHYLAPTGQFLLGVLAYGERFETAQAVTFALIWTGVAVYLADMAVKRAPTR